MTGQVSQEIDGRVADLLTERTGLSFSGASRWRLDRAMCEARSLTGEEKLERVCEAVTVQESYFYREPGRLQTVRDRVLAPARSRGSRLRIWSAGCAAGEEPYTLAAMCLAEGLHRRFEILGTDLSRNAAEAARDGCYTRWSLRALEPDQIGELFETEGRRYRLVDRYRESVSFEQHNLLEPRPASWGRFDLVVCRNVLIYFTPDAAQAAVRALADALVPGGWLVLGASDPLFDFMPELEVVLTSAGPFYRKRAEESSEAHNPGRRRLAGPRPWKPERPTADLSRPDTAVAPLGRTASQHLASAEMTARSEPTERDVDALVATAERALDLADAQRAEQDARALQSIAPERATTHMLLARSLTEQGRLSEAREVVGSAIRRFPEDPDLRLLHAVVMLESGDAVAAADAARQALYLAPGLAAVYPVLARARELLGDSLGAARARRSGRRLLEAIGR